MESGFPVRVPDSAKRSPLSVYPTEKEGKRTVINLIDPRFRSD